MISEINIDVYAEYSRYEILRKKKIFKTRTKTKYILGNWDQVVHCKINLVSFVLGYFLILILLITKI